MRHRAKHLLFVVSLVVLASCAKDTDYISTVPASDNTFLVQLDTLSAAATVVRPDSFKTNYQTYIYAGKYSSTIFGTTLGQAYIRPTIPTELPDLGITSYYDSMVLIMRPHTGFYGDTTSTYKVNLYRVAEDMAYDASSAFYNTSNFNVEAAGIGSASVVYRPNIDDSFLVRINDNLGKTLYNLVRAKAETVTDAAVFTNYFKGIRITPDAQDKVMYAYGTADTSLSFRLYYHVDDGKSVSHYIDFPISNDGYAFSSIKTDRTNTPLAKLDAATEMVSPGIIVNDNLTQVSTRINFPGINEVLKTGYYVKVLSAAINLKPMLEVYTGSAQLPPTLNLYQYSYSAGTTAGPLLSPETETTATGDLNLSVGFGSSLRYTFDITDYINSQVGATANDIQGLVPEVPAGSFYNLVAGLPGNSLYPSKLLLGVLVYNQ